MLRSKNIWSAALLLGLAGEAYAEPGPAVTDPAKAGEDYKIQGEYLGKFDLGDGVEQKFGMQCIALGDDKYHFVAYFGGLPGDGWDGFGKLESDGEMKDGAIEIVANEGAATLKDGAVTVKTPDGNELGKLERIERKSPTEGMAPPEGAVVLFDGKNVDEWAGAKLTEDKLLSPLGSPRGAMTKKKFNDFTLHLEFRTPYMPTARGQGRGNSGLYLQNRYECQVLDSFGLEGLDNECGGFYQVKAPDTNMCFPPLAWQTYDVEFKAAKWGDAPEKDEQGNEVKGDDGKVKTKYQKTENARVTIKQNGVLIHDNVEIKNITPGGEPAESDQPGAIFLQNHGNPVTYRNIWIVEKKG
jgi:hypothetical protein